MLKNLFSWIMGLIKPEKKPIKTDILIGDNETQAVIIVGHNERDQGAHNYLGETEFSFNRRIALKVQERLANRMISVAVIQRQSGITYSQQISRVLKQVKQLSPKLALSLHFNSFKKKAYGCEMLIPRGIDPTHSTWKLADKISDLLNEKLRLVERHQDGVKVISSSHNGSAIVYGLKDLEIAGVLVEPCFANIETRESRAFFENEELYVRILSQSIIESLK